jgi:DNA polymerase-3 subunit delta
MEAITTDPARQGLLYILIGEDSFSIRQALKEIKEGLGDASLLSANTTTLDGQQLTLNQLRAACETTPFLAEKRLIIVPELLQRYEARARAGRGKKKAAGNDQEDELKAIAAYIPQMSDSAVLVLTDSGISTGNSLLKGVADRAVIRSFPLLRGKKLQQWIQQHLKRQGDRASPQAIDLLARLIGGNLWTMASEIEKLALFATGRRIEEEDVRLVVSQGQETNVFAMVDAILELKARIAQQLLQQLLQKGAAPVYLMVMLSRQIQMIVRARELRDQGKSDVEIQTRLGLASEFALRKTLEQAARYRLERLKGIYHRLLETDLSVKTGRRDGELALTILIAELCQQSGL